MKRAARLAGIAGFLIASSCNRDDVIATDAPAQGAVCNRVCEYLPAPGQFINENCTATTIAEACAWAEERLASPGGFVSLGGFGGYIVAGFDRPVVNSGDYDLVVVGNAFATSSEPGIVYVMQDENGDGEPNDTWYELRGSEYGKPETLQDYAVTYYRPAAPGMEVTWRDNRGASGTIDYLTFHTQDSYYPAWVAAESYTLQGTRLEARNYLDGLDWIAPPYEWGYADNFSSADRPAGTEPGVNRFRIADAVCADGRPAELSHIDFVKVQTGVNAKSGSLGELSTEVFGIRACDFGR